MNYFKEYEDYFAPHIFERGVAIAYSDDVTILENTDEKVYARVQGTHLYDVCIEIEKNEVFFTCDCPYADGGNMCKHMAAVLIVAEQSTSQKGVAGLNSSQGKNENDNQQRMLEERVRDLNAEDLHAFLVKALLNDDKLKQAFIMHFLPDTVEVNHLIAMFDSIINRYLGYDGFISYRQAGGLFKDIDNYLDDLKDLLYQGQIVEVAQVLSEITLGFDSVPLDDSDGGSTDFYAYVEVLIREILEEDVQEANNILYEWMDKVMKDPDSWYLREWIEPYWSAQYSEEELINMKIMDFENRLKINKATDYTGRYSYTYIHDLMELVKMKEFRGDSEGEILELLKPYENADSVIWYLVKMAQNKGDLKREETLLLKGFKQGKSNRHAGTTHRFRVALCRYYQRINNRNKYIRCLEEIVIEYHSDLSFYKEYKNQFHTDRWLEHRQSVIDRITAKTRYGVILADIYAEEKMTAELFTWLENKGSLSMLQKYCPHLEESYDERVLVLFLTALDRLSLNAGNKKHYRNIVDWMKYIKELSGGRDAIEKKVSEYRQQYKRRPNFMAELERMM